MSKPMPKPMLHHLARAYEASEAARLAASPRNPFSTEAHDAWFEARCSLLCAIMALQFKPTEDEPTPSPAWVRIGEMIYGISDPTGIAPELVVIRPGSIIDGQGMRAPEWAIPPSDRFEAVANR